MQRKLSFLKVYIKISTPGGFTSIFTKKYESIKRLLLKENCYKIVTPVRKFPRRTRVN